MTERSLLRFSEPALAGLEVPMFDARGAHDGPTLTLLAGVHGCEYTSQAALRGFMRDLDERQLRGRVRAVPTLNVSAFRARSPFVTPEDGKNLNRCFPGNPDGTYSEQLAYAVHERLIRGSDFLVDMHAGDMVEALEPFTLHDESPVADAALAMAEAYGLPFALRQPTREQAVGGATSEAGAALGIPSIVAESGGCGLLQPEAVALHRAGLERLLRHLGMLDGEVPPAPVRRMSRFLWLRCSNEGWWDSSVAVGEDVAEGQEVGRVTDLFGDVLETIHAPAAGVPVFLTTSPAVAKDGLVLGLAAGEWT